MRVAFLWINWLKDSYFTDAIEVQVPLKIVLQDIIRNGFQKMDVL
jgi:hypothetical protein